MRRVEGFDAGATIKVEIGELGAERLGSIREHGELGSLTQKV